LNSYAYRNILGNTLLFHRNQLTHLLSEKMVIRSTSFPFATGVVRICEAILFDEQIILPVFCLVKEKNVCMSLPVIIGKKGIFDYVPFDLSKLEEEQIEKKYVKFDKTESL